ncbi:MAG: hypothetical protein SFU98_02795 [Leptospiraceae bacterium]|nr:hypothetical protein [Leptospiraceae bacterium]
MKIFINEEELNTTLEKEETLGEVYTQITKWIESQGKFVLHCFVDGKETLQEELNQLNVQGTGRLDFYIGENLDLTVSALIELDKYIDKIGNTLFGRDSLTENETKDLKDGLEWISEMLTYTSSILRLNLEEIHPIPEGNSVKTILSNLKSELNSLETVKSIESFLENLRDLKLFVMGLVNKTSLLTVDESTIEEVMKAYSENMEVLKKEFIRVNENFQSGKEALASELLQHSIERLEILLSALSSLKAKFPEKMSSLLVGGKSLEDSVERLHSLLKEVANSLEKNDLVMAGDLLEYELTDVLDSFVPYLKEIRTNFSTKD